MWTYYAEEGNIRYTLRYRSGILQNPEVLRELDSRQLEELEKQRYRILDPEKYLEAPEGILERKR